MKRKDPEKKRDRMKNIVTILAIGACMSTTIAAHAASDAAMRQFAKVSDEYFDQVYFPYGPSTGTQIGYHQYDTRLEDFSRKSIDAQIAALKVFEKRVEAIPGDPASLDLTTRGDREMVLGNIRSTLLTLETIRPWEKNPDNYSSTAANAAFVLMERTFAPPDDRLRSLIAREKQMPAALEAAHQNLKNPPHIYTEIALEQLPDIISFFQTDVPSAFEQAHDPQLRNEFAQSNSAVVTALKNYQNWLRKDVLPNSHGDFRFGAGTYSKLLLYDEMVDTPLPRLLEIGYADLHQNQAEFNRIAHELEPDRKPREVLAELGRDHPAPGQLLQSFHDTFEGLIQF